jgi:protein-tyrosine phosphatase
MSATDEAEQFGRHIPLEGAVNFRDLGGYLGADGQRVRWRRLFRADGLSSLSPTDLKIVADLGIRTVIDLRTAPEVQGGRFPVEAYPVTFVHVPFIDTLPDFEAFKRVPGMLASQYTDMVRDGTAHIKEILTILAREDTYPAVVHCTAGKDRTGVISAIVLSLLGVQRQEVIEDYALSGSAMQRLRAKLVGLYPEAEEAIGQADEMFSADPHNMVGLLEVLAEDHGSIERYVVDLGVPPQTVEALRALLLEPVR